MPIVAVCPKGEEVTIASLGIIGEPINLHTARLAINGYNTTKVGSTLLVIADNVTYGYAHGILYWLVNSNERWNSHKRVLMV
jgi:hypothetical protein